ncbi:RNA-dependent RNA polymerase [Mycena kentingensis (nom. inval.)]|nr:RNA-dependent RNA polymerase [Mycena kentingensis (nom. inval.)]
MEYNFEEYLNELAGPVLPQPPDLREHEPPIFKIHPTSFSMGSIQEKRFNEGFRADELNAHQCMLTLSNGRIGPELFFRIRFPDDARDEEEDEYGDSLHNPFPILSARCLLEDVEAIHIDKIANYQQEYNHRNVQGRLTFALRRPPPIEVDQRRHPHFSRAKILRRATDLDFLPYSGSELGMGAPSTMPRGHWVSTPMKFGLWLTYSFEFDCPRGEWDRVVLALSRLRAVSRPGLDNTSVVNSESSVVARPITILPRRPVRRDPYVGEEDDFPDVGRLLRDARYPFEMRYLVCGLVSQGLLLPGEVPELIHRFFPIESISKTTAAIRALFRLPRRLLNGEQCIQKQVQRIGSARPLPLRIPRDRVAVRRVVVTPTRVLLFPESIEMGNRVVRAWPKQMNEGRFIRVGFADENGRLGVNKRMLEGDSEDPEGGVLARIRNVLRSGVDVAGRHYVFLATSESGLKEHSSWMICEDPASNFTADRVREQMGDFSGEKVVAKYSARMGLCLSATVPVAELDEDDVEELPDVKHGKYTFTDGVGNCSQDLANRCAIKLGSDRTEPSAVQIRMGGYKGVLSVHPHLTGNQVCLRPSMRKFLSPLRGLGVMKVSGFAPAHLNRQAIAILESQGVRVTHLMDMYKRQIERAQMLELDFAALDTGRHPARHIYKNAFIPILKMVKAGLKDELLLKNVLRCIKCQMLRDLKYKARILVNDGAYLLGIADEYDVLEPGQIYCAITPRGKNSRRVITGQCTIFRSPCIHPGDVQRVLAVNHKAFEDYPLTNVVVFSTKKAERDLPSMLGGGDLDGDFFTVIYDPNLQITREHPPGEYTAAIPIRKKHVTISDVQDFVVEYIKNDVLGVVSNYHTAVADYRGPQHVQCLQLAQKASDAVDFGKSGITVTIPEAMKPIRYPDFMDRAPEETYKSTRVLGMMYRMIEPAPQYDALPHSAMLVDTRIARKRVLASYLAQAGALKHSYDMDLESLMRMHNLCEAEIIAGVSVLSEQRRRRAADDAMRGPVREGMEAIRAHYRRTARQWVKSNSSGGGMEGWAIAAYQITHIPELRGRYVDGLNASRIGSVARATSVGFSAADDWEDEDAEYGDVQRRELISFPWMWAQELCDSLDDHDAIKEEDEEEEVGEQQGQRHWIDEWRRGALHDSDDDDEEKKPRLEMLPPSWLPT